MEIWFWQSTVKNIHHLSCKWAWLQRSKTTTKGWVKLLRWECRWPCDLGHGPWGLPSCRQSRYKCYLWLLSCMSLPTLTLFPALSTVFSYPWKAKKLQKYLKNFLKWYCISLLNLLHYNFKCYWFKRIILNLFLEQWSCLEKQTYIKFGCATVDVTLHCLI